MPPPRRPWASPTPSAEQASYASARLGATPEIRESDAQSHLGPPTPPPRPPTTLLAASQTRRHRTQDPNPVPTDPPTPPATLNEPESHADPETKPARPTRGDRLATARLAASPGYGWKYLLRFFSEAPSEPQ